MTLAAAVDTASHGFPPEAGFLQIAGVRADDSAFRWEDTVFPGYRCLIWPAGVLIVPDSLPVENFGVDAILLPFSLRLRGVGAGGILEFDPGAYMIDEALVLSDGTISLYVNSGRLEIRPGRISYVHDVKSAVARGQYFILGGVVLAIALLMMRLGRRGALE